MRRDLLLLIIAVVLLRLPFLDQAVQGDDVYYLLIARNAQVDPLHPMQMGFRLQGELVWAAGHTRPPLNAYVLAGLLGVFGEVKELYFHLFYVAFSLAAAISMYFLARRFTTRPFLASLLLLSVPSFVVNGNKLEADLPLLAFWLAGFALFVYGKSLPAAIMLAAAGLCAYQTMFAVPILAYYIWIADRRNLGRWLAVAAAPLALGGWQLFEFAASGTAPATVLAGYFETYDLLALSRKLSSWLALVGHLGWVISPVLILATCRRGAKSGLFVGAAYGAAAAVVFLLTGYTGGQRLFLLFALGTGLLLLVDASRTWWSSAAMDERFLSAWIVLYFAGSLAVFYAGSARYLLPLAAPAILLTIRRIESRTLLYALTAVHLAVGLALAAGEKHYAGQYREFARRLAPMVESTRLWSNAEWGLRYYLGELGSEPLLRDQTLRAGEVVVTSELAGAVPFRVTDPKQELLHADVEAGPLALRTIGLESRSGYSSSEFGILPFDWGAGSLDRVTAYKIGYGEPTTGYLPMDAPDAEAHLLGGFHGLEAGKWRWMAKHGSASLLVPRDAREFELVFHIPEGAPARRVAVELDGEILGERTYSETGSYTLAGPVDLPAGRAVRVTISVDKSLRPPGDGRDLGIVVTSFGFK